MDKIFDIMRTKIVSSQQEMDDVVSEQEKEGYFLSAVSNTGLPQGKARITFLPASAKKNAEDVPVG